jgi:hypothetical protein
MWDLKQAARSHSEEGMQILLQCMRDRKADWNTRLKAIELLWERGYGRPEQHGDVNVSHRFVIAPNTMAIDEWLANKGQPKSALPPPDDPEPSTDDDDPDRKLN